MQNSLTKVNFGGPSILHFFVGSRFPVQAAAPHGRCTQMWLVLTQSVVGRHSPSGAHSPHYHNLSSLQVWSPLAGWQQSSGIPCADSSCLEKKELPTADKYMTTGRLLSLNMVFSSDHPADRLIPSTSYTLPEMGMAISYIPRPQVFRERLSSAAASSPTSSIMTMGRMKT